jgi:hypothetical protein
MGNLMRHDFVTGKTVSKVYALEGFTIHYNPFHGRIR